MAIIRFFKLMIRMDDLIQRRATGSPQELASRLQVTERMVYKYIEELKLLGAPINYDYSRRSYFYSRTFSLHEIIR